MNQQETKSKKIAYKGYSFYAVALFLFYWLITINMLYLREKVDKVIPQYTALHKTFWRQSWRLFTYTKMYNRQLNLIVRNQTDTLKTDTTDIVQYSLAQKRKYAPFNNYEEGVDRTLYLIMNLVYASMKEKGKALKAHFPGKTDEWYVMHASALIQADTVHPENLRNLEAFARKMMKETNKSTTGKEFQLQMTHKFIPPQMPSDTTFNKGDVQIIFQTGYKPF